ncbi:ichor-like [Coccinella septempunctata]|uniref:ichor-like n=1 Tax=Coccinella septempunctata TaxID=41139 RepID=UPI001D0705B3|nr:ichor-like [Coccinella septempunctata]XP_044751926.1 ichor-like [Coccinella septempunctata]XP_044751927.1 ichor-like [Coccinella septempunctata]XP_044751928.1 ichor-like [Coccinella septempunctata]XP_044751929.1 ichor-like [Coccinella septempunctata]
MATMKYPNISAATSMAISGSGSHVEEVDLYSCWQNSAPDDYMDTNKLILDSSITNLGSDRILMNGCLAEEDYEIESKPSLDNYENILTPSNNSLAELKPLPPFTGYTANLSINGIQGHHYHTISQRVPEENNNSYGNYNEQNVVSSSTCSTINDNCDEIFSSEDTGNVNYINPDSASGSNYVEYSPTEHAESLTQVKTEMNSYDMTQLGMDIFGFIDTTMVDTTVNNNNPESEGTSRGSWTDIDHLIDAACEGQTRNLIGQDGLPEYILPTTPPNDFNGSSSNIDYNIRPSQQNNSTLQSLLSNSFMPLLQNRLQNGPPIKQESPSSTNYGSDLISASSPPANVVSTTDNLMLTVNGRFVNQYAPVHNMDDHRMRSPDMLHNYPHTTTTTPNITKKARNKAQKRQSPSSSVYQRDPTSGMMGKEKPVHRCSICNRGFLNKSNIKVHMRTHTGEKPFRCETCSKSFRQKAHLLKHQQIHKRIGRD